MPPVPPHSNDPWSLPVHFLNANQGKILPGLKSQELCPNGSPSQNISAGLWTGSRFCYCTLSNVVMFLWVSAFPPERLWGLDFHTIPSEKAWTTASTQTPSTANRFLASQTWFLPALNLAPSTPIKLSQAAHCPSAPAPFLFPYKLLFTLQNSAQMPPPLQSLPSPPPLTRGLHAPSSVIR